MGSRAARRAPTQRREPRRRWARRAGRRSGPPVLAVVARGGDRHSGHRANPCSWPHRIAKNAILTPAVAGDMLTLAPDRDVQVASVQGGTLWTHDGTC